MWLHRIASPRTSRNFPSLFFGQSVTAWPRRPSSAPSADARRANEHLDAAAGVDGIEAFYAQCAANGVTIIKPLTATPWGTKDFYIEDPDGYIVCFGGRPAAD
jgi:catechol 2,3-dioxygenase-like lactoylglutathione lyase family enzyme